MVKQPKPTRRGPKLKLVSWLPTYAMVKWHGWTERYARAKMAIDGPDLPQFLWTLVWAGLMDEANGGLDVDAWQGIVADAIACRRRPEIPMDDLLED